MAERVDGVAVVGAGLAGLTLAAGLRTRGLPVEVLTADVGGAGYVDRGLCLWGGALAALERIGLDQEASSRGAPIQRLCLWSATGRRLLEVSAADAPALGGLAIRGSTLLEVLREACADVPIHTDRHVIGYGEDEQGILIDLEMGGPVRARVTVGADGMRSVIRLQCLDDGPPIYSGDSVFEGIGPAAPWLVPGTLHLYWGRYGVRAGAVAVDRDTRGSGTSAWWVSVETGPIATSRTEPSKRELEKWLSEMSGPLPDLVAATAEEKVQRSDVFARKRPRMDCSGPVTLIGDAAHPLPATMRMGGSLAIEDAVALTEMLAADANPLRALRVYEQVRSVRVDWVARTVWRLRALETRYSAAAAWARDTVVAGVPGSVLRPLLSRLAGGGDTIRPAARTIFSVPRTTGAGP
jgi:FAD-dependent urate hydroxylase